MTSQSRALLIGACALVLPTANCAVPGTINRGAAPRPDQETTLIIRVVPARALIESGHKTGPGTCDTRPYTYRIEANGKVICGIVFGDDILDGSPHALARLAWEEANCRGHGGDVP